MQDMLTPIFGETGAIIVQYAITLAVIAILVALVIWGVRRFSATTVAPTVRGRQPRLAIVDTLPVDAKRKLVLLRRDNVEHLVLIGGPSDIVVEPTIVRQRVAQRPGQVTAARPGAAEARQAVDPMAEETSPVAELQTPVRAAEAEAAPEDTTARFAARRAMAPVPARAEPPRREAPVAAAPARVSEQPVRRYRAVAAQPEGETAAQVSPRRETARAETAPQRPEPRSESAPSRYATPLRPVADDPVEPVPGYEAAVESAPTPASAFAPHPPVDLQDTAAEEVVAVVENVEQSEAGAPAEEPSDLEKEMARLLGQISTTRRE